MKWPSGCVVFKTYAFTHVCMRACLCLCGDSSLRSLVPRRYTNEFDELKINRIRIFAMF